jgi:hypothetical protein
MQQIIGLKEFKKNPDVYAKKAKAGHSFIVVKQSKPMFRISSPIFPDLLVPEADLDEVDGKGWKTVLDFTKIKKGGVPFEEVIQASKFLDNEQNAKIVKKTSGKRQARYNS